MYRPIRFNPEVCTGCNLCVELCPMDILAPADEKGAPPVVAHPEECWYDGVCWERCPRRDEGAIRVVPPLPMRVSILRGER